MKQTSNEVPVGKTIQSIRHQALDKLIELQESSAKVCELAEHIAKRQGISMVDYSDYNREKANNKLLTDEYLLFTHKFKLSLR